MKINPSIFRGYDIRGLVGVDLSEKVFYILGKAYATFLYRRRINTCVVGRDIRQTSERYQDAFTKALIESGINVIDIGLTLSQIMYFAQYHFLSKGGAMITASHNPKEFNGLKLAVGFSDTLLTHEIQEVKEIADSGDFKDYGIKGKYTKADVFPYYVDDLFTKLPENDFGFKIVLDTINATPGAFIPEILKRAGCEFIHQNAQLDGSFPMGTPDPTEKTVLERLSKRVIEEKADLGLVFDSDGDRLGVVDENGDLIWNDVLVAIFAEDVLEYLPNSPIVFNALCSKATSDTIVAHGGKPLMWLTGHSFIKAKVKEERAPFGGELSGHFFFMDGFYGHDDTVYATLRLLAFLKRHNKTLKQVVDSLPKYVSSPEIKLGLADAIKFKFIDEVISKEIKEILPDAKYVTIDGFRADTEDKMVIIRASQNGPYITIKFEGKTQKEYDELKEEIKKVLQKHDEIDWHSGVNTDAFN